VSRHGLHSERVSLAVCIACISFEKRDKTTLIVKLASDYVPLKETMNEQMRYREARFYRDIAPLLTINVPEAYYSAWAGEDIVIIMADLGDITIGDEGMEASVAETEKVLTAIAKFHSQWWNHKVTKESWLSPAAESLDREKMVTSLEASLLNYGEQYPYMAKCVEQFLKHLPNLPDEMEKPNHLSLVHGDFHRKNVHFRDDGSLVLFDWQVVEASLPVVDIANWLLQYISIESRRGHEDRLLQHYYAELSDVVKAQYSFRNLKSDYANVLPLIVMRMYYILDIVDLDVVGGEDMPKILMPRLEEAAKDNRLLLKFRFLPLLIWSIRVRNLIQRVFH